MPAYKDFIKDVYAKDAKGNPKSKHPSVYKKIDGKPISARGKILGAEYKKMYPKKDSDK